MRERTLRHLDLPLQAGLHTLRALRQDGFYERLEATSASLADGLRLSAADAGLADATCFQRVGSMLCCFFAPPPVTDYTSAIASNTKAFAAYFHAMLESGVYIAPSQFEAMFVSGAHDDADIDTTASAARRAFAAAAKLM